MGYAFETAIADILDNAIAAGATYIHISSLPQKRYVAIRDDGHGMSHDELIQAMRFGARSPLEVRAAGDLGRFGLGMKTASLSQCKRVTVVSKRSGEEITAARWDLDTLEKTQEWTLELPPIDDDIPELQYLREQSSGTIVIWENFDRFGADSLTSIDDALRKHVNTSKEHIALTFHRYIQGTGGARKVRFFLNQKEIPANDPFEGARLDVPEHIPCPGEAQRLITFTPATFRHEANAPVVSDEERKAMREGLREKQGFYLYRNYRLIVSHTWFGIRKRHDDSRFARIMIDIQNDMDHDWNIDVRKSSAAPPIWLRGELKRIADTYVKPSVAQHRSRARTLRAERGASEYISVWNRVQDRDGIKYRLNHEYDTIRALLDELNKDQAASLKQLLKQIESALPCDQIHEDFRSYPETFQENQSPKFPSSELRTQLEPTIRTLLDHGETSERLFGSLVKTPPWAQQDQNELRSAIEAILEKVV